jgi:hypothetical protein
MKTISLEIRDRATFIPAIAVRMIAEPGNEAERYLLGRCGYQRERPAVILARMNGDGHAYSDPYDWKNRTMQVAHLWVTEHFDELENGQVVDVEFVLGKSTAPKISERLEAPF